MLLLLFLLVIAVGADIFAAVIADAAAVIDLIQFTFICIALFTIRIVSKLLYRKCMSTLQFRVICYQR